MYTLGTTNSVNTVPIAMPVTRTIPIEFLAIAPGPVTKTSGMCPQIVAADVIKIGLSRVSDASRTASTLLLPSR
jgi:hypothetical protein